MKYIIGNWKANKTGSETSFWFHKLSSYLLQNKHALKDLLEVVVCPSSVYLPTAKKLKEELGLPIKLGAQNVSPYENGPYTGEISASQLREFAEYVIIGHSERRTNFHEDEEMLSEKVKQAVSSGLKPVFCVQDEKTFIPAEVLIVAYEPIWAIGTGKADTPVSANQIAKIIKQRLKVEAVIYGGSVNPLNVADFFKEESLDGVLLGNASLNPDTFREIIINAAKI